MEKQISAVDWLVNQLNKQGFSQVVTDEEIQQAKELERQQIIDFANDWMYNSDTSAKEYYQEKFKQ